jgi:CDP-glucose 4,6-dehydratase
MGRVAMKETLMAAVYRNKRVLVTGDTGFKGSWLSLWLHSMGADISGFALPVERPEDHFATAGLATVIHHVDGDIRDLDALKNVFAKSKPEIVFHLAAQPLVTRSYEEPKLTFDTNVGGSANLLECVRHSPSVRALIYVTSDKCYRNREWVWGYRENDELGGHDPYSASKAAAEVLFASYQDSFFRERHELGAASVRAGNVIGGGDWARDRIVPDCIRALMRREPVTLRSAAATRPWQHVLEVLRGYLTLGACLLEDPAAYSGSWNFGPRTNSIRTVRDLATSIIERWGSGAIREAATPGVHETTILHLNCDKANQRLRWNPVWDFDRTVEETVRWYKSTAQGDTPFEVSLRQIGAYVEEVHDDRWSASHALASDPR